MKSNKLAGAWFVLLSDPAILIPIDTWEEDCLLMTGLFEHEKATWVEQTENAASPSHGQESRIHHRDG